MPCAAPVTMATLSLNVVVSKDISQLLPCGDGDGLDLGVLLEAGHTHLAADPGLLEPAEGDIGAGPDAAVHADGPGAETGGDGLRLLDVGAVHRPGQPVVAVVRDPDG